MRGQTILITGGTGTFGTAFVRYALTQDVERVIVLSRGEHRQAELKRQFPDSRLECWIRDVRDPDGLMWAFRANPDVVIHAAALKRVEVCEADPREAMRTNVDGTRHVVEQAMLAGVPKVLLISSDKACSPETLYGTTKAAAEAVAIGQNRYRGSGHTRISAVRYGNVLGSQGSVLDTFFAARSSGDPLTITDIEATRFWWGIEDAVIFVATVLERMQGAEIFIPKIASARVMDLAQAIAPDSSVTVTGMRGSEKRHEAMINVTEARYAWELPDSYVLLPKRLEWWSAQPPAGATRVPDGFTYTSDGDPLAVSFEPLEGRPCALAS